MRQVGAKGRAYIGIVIFLTVTFPPTSSCPPSLTCWRWTGWRGPWSTCPSFWTRPPMCLTQWTSPTMLWPASTGSPALRRPWMG